MSDKIPKPFYNPSSANFNMEELIFSMGKKDARYIQYQTFKGEWLFRYKIPPFQRPFCWTEEQCAKFIESAWLGFSLGTYLVNKVEWKGEKIHEFDDYLLDGQQRLNAIKMYLDDKFKVFGYLYSELDEMDHIRFSNITFTQDRVYVTDLGMLKELYNRLNFGGTAHTEDQRAL